MKNNVKKAVAASLAAVVMVGSIGMTAHAVQSKDDDKSMDTPAKTYETKAEKTATGNKLNKEETVYVIADASGAVDKVIVSDWIQNGTKTDAINDKTELKNIKNVKGDESFSMNSDNMCVWDAKGNDIYYQGTTEKALPVDVKVTYTLDGKTVTPEELAGKSGKVKIRYDYTNNQYEMRSIDGKNEKIYVPFVMATGLLLDNEVFSDVNVTNGKLINDGDKTMVAGIAFPGLKEDLGLTSIDLDIPSYVEITAQVKNFELKNTVTVATSQVFEELSTDKLDSATLKEGLTKITDGMSQLLDGSSQLYDGLAQLLDKSDDLITGIKALTAGAKTISENLDSLSAGAQGLDAGATSLKNGLAQLDSKSGQLTGGAANVFNTLLTQTHDSLVAAGITTLPTLTIENYDQTLMYVKSQLDSSNPAAAARVLAAKESLDNYNAFYQGVIDYTNGVKSAKIGADQVAAGAKSVSNGASALAEGARNLYAGLMQIDEKAPQLIGGIEKLKDGSMQLSDGLKMFNEEGISKITELLDGDLGSVTARISATIDVARNYSSFAGKADDMNGTVKFIYKTAEVK